VSGEWGQNIVGWAVITAASLTGAVFDVRTGRIPNRLCGAVLAAGLLWAWQFGGIEGIRGAAAGCILLSTPFVILFAAGKGGAGDAKLMAAIGVWTGWQRGVVVLVCVCTAGAMLAVAKAVARGNLGVLLAGVWNTVRTPVLRACRIVRPNLRPAETGERAGFNLPYGAAIFAGVCLAAAAEWLW
jgi:Flp pilus assembly protein protease CpaA